MGGTPIAGWFIEIPITVNTFLTDGLGVPLMSGNLYMIETDKKSTSYLGQRFSHVSLRCKLTFYTETQQVPAGRESSSQSTGLPDKMLGFAWLMLRKSDLYPSCPVIHRFRLCSPWIRLKGGQKVGYGAKSQHAHAWCIATTWHPHVTSVQLIYHHHHHHHPKTSSPRSACQLLVAHQLLKAFFPVSSKPCTANVPSSEIGSASKDPTLRRWRSWLVYLVPWAPHVVALMSWWVMTFPLVKPDFVDFAPTSIPILFMKHAEAIHFFRETIHFSTCFFFPATSPSTQHWFKWTFKGNDTQVLGTPKFHGKLLLVPTHVVYDI